MRSMTWFLSLLLLLQAAPALAVQPISMEPIAPPVAPEVTAEAWIVWDETYGRELGSLESDRQRPMASTTKMMTAVVALNNASLDDQVRISELAAGVGESEIGLVVGESVPLRDLLAGLLLQSANDAAMAIAEHVGGSVEGFAGMMNDQARQWELENTNFVNPHGLDDPLHYSSARDLLVIGQEAMAIPEIEEIVQSRSIEISDAPDGTERTARTTNQMIGTYDGAFGVKTGYTDDAGLTLVTGADRDGRRVYVVVMGSEDHFGDAALLLNYAFEEYQLLRLLDPEEIVATFRTSEGTIEAVPEDEVEVFASSTEAAEVEVTPSFEDGEPTLMVDVAGETVGSASLTVEPPALPNLGDALAWASTYWDWIWRR